ncbi:hypothetical protein EVAR_100114_1 [Eumeta japonica]|uniref:Uncharacterized protein n=1 Tax=Eumeta variegata TaxID=151549 RepID=A0A4C1YRP6_EUMVA|nr:hypothetical protein EVAR_100114_1 [Eumeta japonica]
MLHVLVKASSGPPGGQRRALHLKTWQKSRNRKKTYGDLFFIIKDYVIEMLKTLEGGVVLEGCWPSHCGSVAADIFWQPHKPSGRPPTLV